MENLKKLHPRAVWLFFFKCAGSFLIAIIILAIWLGMGIGGRITGSEPVIGIMLIIIVLFLLICYIWARLAYHFWRYQLTENAYKSERGIIFKRYISIPYERIQNIDIYRGILDRLLGLSDIQIQTAGYGAMGGRGIKGFGSEGRLPGLQKQEAEKLRDELIKRAKGGSKSGV